MVEDTTHGCFYQVDSKIECDIDEDDPKTNEACDLCLKGQMLDKVERLTTELYEINETLGDLHVTITVKG